MAQYADIVEIAAPAEAQPGSRVDITVRVKNTYSAAIGIMVGRALEYGVTPWPGITFPQASANVGPGATCSFGGYFTMPESGATVHAYSYWYGGGSWHLDDEMTKVVQPAEEIPSQYGSIEIVSYAKV